MADTSMLLLGGKLKFKESLSGRLGDVLSQLYIDQRHAQAPPRRSARRAPTSRCWRGAIHDSGQQDRDCAVRCALRNFPIRPVGWLLWAGDLPVGPPRARRRAIA
jgi:acyl-CoA dehydrogenase